MIWRVCLCILAGYLLGGINGAIIISKSVRHEDVREHGSGNAGLTNFYRSYGGWITLLVIAIDVGKVVTACMMGMFFFARDPEVGKVIAGTSAIIGHMFPVWFGFHGGKGILSTAAFGAMVDWRVLLIVLAVFIVIFAITHYVSLGSICGVFLFAVLLIILHFSRPEIWIPGSVVPLFCIFMHRTNIVRLLKHEERKTYILKKKEK